MTIRAVLDANVFVSAAIRQGPSYPIVNAWLESQAFELILSEAVLAEIDDVLARPRLAKWIVGADARAFVHGIRIVAELVVESGVSADVHARSQRQLPHRAGARASRRRHRLRRQGSAHVEQADSRWSSRRRRSSRCSPPRDRAHTRSRDTQEPQTLPSAVTPDLHPTGHYKASSATSDGRGSDDLHHVHLAALRQEGLQ